MIQQNSKRSFLRQLKFAADLVARLAREFIELGRIASGKEDGVAFLQAKLRLQRSSTRSSPKFLAIGPAASPSRKKI